MPASGSPTVRRRRLAAELRKLRGSRKAGEIARAIGWSASKISRAESGHDSLPPEEIEKLIDYYAVTDPFRGQLLELAKDAVQRGWWDDYTDALAPEYVEFIGLEAEASSCLQWQPNVVPGLLQTEDYARQINAAFRAVNPTISPSVQERFLRVRMLRQARLTEEPVLQFSVVLDEAVLLRGVGDRGVMRAQLEHLVAASDLPNVDLRILPLSQNIGLHGSSFTLMSFGSRGIASSDLEDIVSIEILHTELYETDTYLYRLFFQALSKAALPPAESRQSIISMMEAAWS
jgi:transcriptional regulator with XRE-family HTH domain